MIGKILMWVIGGGIAVGIVRYTGNFFISGTVFSGNVTSGNITTIIGTVVPFTGLLAGNNTTTNYTWMKNYTTPYADNISVYVGANREVLYAPSAIIEGTDLPDREATGGSNNAVITWGANPSGVTSTLTSFDPSTTEVTVSSIPDGTQDIAPLASDNTTKVNPSSSTPPTTPISPIMVFLAGQYAYNIPEFILWIMAIFIMSVVVFAYTLGTFNHIGAAGIIGSAVWGLGIVLVHLPQLWLSLSVLGVAVSLAQENR